MSDEKSDWEKCVEFHGHICPGLAMGYRAATIGLRELATRRALDEELVAIVENDACGVDAVMVITGCTLGKGNLLFRDFGKHAYTFMSRKSGVGVRICVKADPRNIQAVSLSGPSIAQQILDLPQEEFCTVQTIEEKDPEACPHLQLRHLCLLRRGSLRSQGTAERRQACLHPLRRTIYQGMVTTKQVEPGDQGFKNKVS